MQNIGRYGSNLFLSSALLMILIMKVSANFECDGHFDASCLPSYFIDPPACEIDNDCIDYHNDNSVKGECHGTKCKFILNCPLGFFSWNDGCLPYSINGQKCPAGSDQCIQGLLCVDGTCYGACAEGEVLVDGKCVAHGNLGCIEQDCLSDGCPNDYPICTHKEALDTYHCCKKKHRKPTRSNRHVEASVEIQKPQNQHHVPKILKYKTGKYDITKIDFRNIPRKVNYPRFQIIQIPSQRAINTISTATVSPYAQTVASLCVPFTEVQIGTSCYPLVQAGGACTYSAQCPSRTSINGRPPYLCINNICQLSVVCSPGYFMLNNVCVKYSASGQTCTTSTSQCLSGSTCINGECYSGCGYNQLLIDNVCVGYADYGCILRSCESDSCPTTYSVCNYLRSQNAYVCCTEQIITELLCPNTGIRPQLAFSTNIPIDCVARQCAKGYACTSVVVSGSSRYICCPKISPASIVNPLNGYLSVCLKQTTKVGCTPVSTNLCFCSYPSAYATGYGTTYGYDATLATFTTAFPNYTTTTTTTAATTTTTTTSAATTTTTTVSSCQNCSFSAVTLTNGTSVGEIVRVPNGIQTVNGCSQMTAVCDASSVSGVVSMEFNYGTLGGPTDGTTATASATLNCVNGLWYYTSNGVTSQIYEISCLSSSNTSSCTSCSLNSITLVQGTLVGEKPTSTGIQVVDGCQQLTVTCDASSVTGAYVYMAFNSYTGGPTSNFLSKVTATLKCVNGVWTYTEGTTTTTITQVDCLQNTSRKRLMKIVQTG